MTISRRSRGRRHGRRRFGQILAVLLVLAGVAEGGAGCGGSSWNQAVGPTGTVRATFEYTPGYSLDVLTPTTPTDGTLPVFVTMHGCCGTRDDLAVLADGLAAAGSVVFNVDWIGIRPGGFPIGYQQATCAVRTAKNRAARYGGDPGRVVLLGWSDGAMVAAVAALAGERFPGPCLVSQGDSAPEALVGVAGFYGWQPDAAGRIHPQPLSSSVTAFFGGTPDTAPDAWAMGNPYSALGARGDLVMRLVVSSHDALRVDNRRFAHAASARCHDVTVTVVEYREDPSLIAPRTREGQETLHVAMGALDVPDGGESARAPEC